ncbi:MAG: DNA replication protein DnaC, partial [Peptostreptococcaceae bacterium]
MKESKLRDILVSYERKRDRAESDLENRKKDVYKQIPEIKTIEEEVSTIGLKLTRLVLSNPSDKEKILMESKSKMGELKAKKDALLRQYKVPEWYLDIQYNCNTCEDRGFLKNGHKCNCLKQEIINDAYKMSNLSKLLDNQNFSSLDTSIFTNEKLPGSNVSPYENIVEIVSISEVFIMDFDK